MLNFLKWDREKGQDTMKVIKSLMIWLIFFALVFAVYWNILGYLKEQIDLQKTASKERVNQYTQAELEDRLPHQELMKLNVTTTPEDRSRIVVVRIS